MKDNNDGASLEPIAIVGMGCRFPGLKDCPTDSPQSFWHLLNTEDDILREIPASRWDIDTYYDSERSAPGKMYVRKGYFLDNVDQFDCQFFNLAPKEADSLDPQQRLILEVSWEALESAYVNPAANVNSQTGIFVGTSWDDYSSQRLYASALTAIDRYSLLSNQRSSVSGRIAHLLGVYGPALTIDTACASSLSAVHLASQSLRSGECDLALAGGVFLMLAPETMVGFCRLGLLSGDGRTRAFNHDADGFGQGEGVKCQLHRREKSKE